MNSAIFNFNEHGVRIAFDANNEPLFCLADVCGVLGIKNQNPKRFNLDAGGVT